MPTAKKLSEEEMIRRHESPDYDAFEAGAVEVRSGQPSAGAPPISIRLSQPLLESLDRIAESQHRKRSNLIQHILWEYVHAHDKPK